MTYPEKAIRSAYHRAVIKLAGNRYEIENTPLVLGDVKKKRTKR